MNWLGVATSVAIATVTAAVSSLAPRIGRAGWITAVQGELDVYDRAQGAAATEEAQAALFLLKRDIYERVLRGLGYRIRDGVSVRPLASLEEFARLWARSMVPPIILLALLYFSRIMSPEAAMSVMATQIPLSSIMVLTIYLLRLWPRHRLNPLFCAAQEAEGRRIELGRAIVEAAGSEGLLGEVKTKLCEVEAMQSRAERKADELLRRNGELGERLDRIDAVLDGDGLVEDAVDDHPGGDKGQQEHDHQGHALNVDGLHAATSPSVTATAPATRSACAEMRGEIVLLPVYTAGGPAHGSEEVTDVPRSVYDSIADPGAFIIRVRGNCMNRRFPDQSNAISSPRTEPRNGDAVVAELDGELIIRQYFRGASTLVLSPDSYDPSYADIVFDDPDAADVRFQGVIKWFQAAGVRRH